MLRRITLVFLVVVSILLPVHLGLSQARPPAQENPITYGETRTGHLDDSGSRDNYTFQGTAGDVITISALVTSEESVRLHLMLQDMNNMTQADDEARRDVLIDHYTLPASGYYVIALESLRNGGDYSLTLALNSGAVQPPQPGAITPVPQVTTAPLLTPTPTITPTVTLTPTRTPAGPAEPVEPVETPTPTGAPGQPQPQNVEVQQVAYSVEPSTFRFFIDLAVSGYEGQRLTVLIWFAYEDWTNIPANSTDPRYNSTEGYLLAGQVIQPCCPFVTFAGETAVVIDVPYSQFPNPTDGYTFVPVIEVRAGGQVLTTYRDGSPHISLDIATLSYIKVNNTPYSAAICQVLLNGVNILPDSWRVMRTSQSPPLPIRGGYSYVVEVISCQDRKLLTSEYTFEPGYTYTYDVGSESPLLEVGDVRVSAQGHMIHFDVDLMVYQMRGPRLLLAAWPLWAGTDSFISNNGDPAYIDSNNNLWAWRTISAPQEGSVLWQFDIPLNQFPVGDVPISLRIASQLADGTYAGGSASEVVNFTVSRPVPVPVESHPCTDGDIDCDGVPTGIEKWIAGTFTPAYYLDEEEGVDKVAFLYQVTSDVTCVWQGPEEETVVAGGNDYLLTIVTTWEKDYVEYIWWDSLAMNAFEQNDLFTVPLGAVQGVGSWIWTGHIGETPDWSDVGSFIWETISPVDEIENLMDVGGWVSQEDFIHFGDTERLRLCIRASEGQEQNPLYGENLTSSFIIEGQEPLVTYYRIMSLEFRRHGGTHSYQPQEMERWETPYRPVVYVSEGKHGQYTRMDECSGWAASEGFFQGITWQEDCGYYPDDSSRVLRPYESPDYVESLNVGEPDHRIEPPLISAMFPGELAWESDGAFCGGHRDEVDSPKALADYMVSVVRGEETICSGGISTKWWTAEPENSAE